MTSVGDRPGASLREDSPPIEALRRAAGPSEPPPPDDVSLPPRAASAAHPLQAAFTGEPPRAPASTQHPDGTIALEALGDLTQHALARANGGGVLLRLAGGDPARPPLVLVHGLNGSGADVRDIAARFLAQGRPVHVFVYDSEGQSVTRSSTLLAHELTRLRATTGSPRLDLVGHSMGGLVARAALNELDAPGFEAVNLRMLDSPVEAMAHGVPGWLYPIAAFFMRLLGFRAQIDMMSRSDFFANLHRPLPAGTDVRLHMSSHSAPNWDVRSLPELDDDELTRLRATVLDGAALPEASRSWHLLRALREDARFGGFVERLRGASEPDAIRSAYEASMPRFDGTHVSILNDAASEHDLVDVLARELRG